MQLHQNPSQFFDQGQYLLADSGYDLTRTIIPAYKAPATEVHIITNFNYCLAKA
ncbi:hypothetical protein PGT21_006204 [Puccinia graminis f. sp. tritici]|uniref:DDE Tnp4 domain-containing protein n=1 Tax=Puccinia graminis f. sp. tritici TaxID=56615 RepID=A0A5B0PQK2_PUCGR|nr:hypothetical protein PGT21_006204 [Puccinia graminis f. sp. tritici]